MTIGPFVVEAARVTHTESSFGFRVSTADGGVRVWSTRATAAARRTSTRSSGRATCC